MAGRVSARWVAQLFAIGGLAMAAAAPGALAASFTFVGVDQDNNSWDDPANWSPTAVPGSTDSVIVPGDHGVAVFDGSSETVQSIGLDGGLNVNTGGTLHVTGDITNNGVNSAYFVNGGSITVDGTIINTCTNCGDPDTAYFGYVGNSHEITGDLDNSGGVVNGDGGTTTGVTWTGDVINRATGEIINTGAAWNGAVTSNAGGIFNDFGATWTGDVKSNSSYIENTGGSTWTGNIVSNDADHVIANTGGATWNGDVQSNDGSVDNDGGTWNGNMTSNGSLVLAGTVNGFIDNQNGGFLYVLDPLSGVTSLTNNGAIVMEDGDANDSIGAQSWSGTGTATFDFAPGLGLADHVVLSGGYSAATTLDLTLVGPSGRALVDAIPLVEVGGAITGTLDVAGLPADGVISYRLVQDGSGWFVTTTLNDAPPHAASAAALLTRSAGDATLVPTNRAGACGDGRWVRALGTAANGTLSGTSSGLALGGVQVGNEIDCIKLDSGATFGIGATAGGLGGSLSEDFGGGDHLNGTFGEGFGGVYGALSAGPLQAMLQGQIGIAGLGFSDPEQAVDHATLTNTRLSLSGDATYELRLGAVSFIPEAGFKASSASSSSSDFADVGGMRLTSDPTIDAYAGATIRGGLALPDGVTTVTPYVSLLLHDQPLSPASALFTDLAGGTADVPLDQLGAYGALGLGADLVRVPARSGKALRAGVKADFKFGPNVNENSYSAYAQMKF
jgi:hypothetical protein